MAGIRRNRFCKMLDESEIEAIFESMQCFVFSPGETVVRQGDPGKSFFVIHRGTLEVFSGGQLKHRLSRGDTFGDVALLYECARTETVVAAPGEPVEVWGASSDVFRQVLKQAGEKHDADHRAFLNRVRLFDGLSAKQKDRINKLAIYTEAFEPGSCIVSQGSVVVAVYFVKQGELGVYRGGALDASGHFAGGTRISLLGEGDCFGEAEALSNEHYGSTVVAETGSQLVCIGVQQLREVLGDDMLASLRRSYIHSVMSKMAVLSRLSDSQQRRILAAWATRTYDPGQAVEKCYQVIIVMEGSLQVTRDADVVTVTRGGWFEDEKLTNLAPKTELACDLGSPRGRTMSGTALEAGLKNMRAGGGGATLAVLMQEDLNSALREFGVISLSGAEQAYDYIRKTLLARKVPIFRQLTDRQIDVFISSFLVKRLARGAEVIRQGEVGSDFYVVACGELTATVDGQFVRNFGVGDNFGEREILFDEPRLARVEVTSQEAELWSVSRPTFLEVVTGPMREELVNRIQLQDRTVSMKSLRHERLIGVGSFGSVRLVRHIRTSMPYALKRVRKTDGVVPACVKQECALLAELDHPLLLCLARTFETAGSIYILTELVTGGCLYDQMKKGIVFTHKQAQFYFASLVLMLEVLHNKNIIYRDLKPENVMLDGKGYLKLIDFGLSKKLNGPAGRTFTVAGTVYYIAPEVIRGRGYGFEVDLWSLGALCYELVCGRLPFGKEEDEQGDIAAMILEDELAFPDKYQDLAGRRIMTAWLCKQPEKRLGVGPEGWEDIKNDAYFNEGVSGNLFSKIMGREIEAPIIPTEHYTDEKQLESVTLSDAEELGGEREYLLDNNVLNAQTAGLVYRRSMRLEDRDMRPETQHPLWGSTVVGRERGDGWLKVGSRYLPMVVNGVTVLTPVLYVVDNSKLHAPTAGLVYRLTKNLEDHDVCATTAHPNWGSHIRGINEGDGWLRVADRYLPMSVNGAQVLTVFDGVPLSPARPLRAAERLLRTPADAPSVPWGGGSGSGVSDRNFAVNLSNSQPLRRRSAERRRAGGDIKPLDLDNTTWGGTCSVTDALRTNGSLGLSAGSVGSTTSQSTGRTVGILSVSSSGWDTTATPSSGSRSLANIDNRCGVGNWDVGVSDCGGGSLGCGGGSLDCGGGSLHLTDGRSNDRNSLSSGIGSCGASNFGSSGNFCNGGGVNTSWSVGAGGGRGSGLVFSGGSHKSSQSQGGTSNIGFGGGACGMGLGAGGCNDVFGQTGAGGRGGCASFSGGLNGGCGGSARGVTPRDRLRNVFKSWDLDGNGKISSQDLAAVVRESCTNVSQDDLDRVFAVMDANGEGLVDYRELVQWLYKSRT
eukprot:TRINITY_DN11174_c0_g1_i1.p1 TRINITY_DN11174_c0_g1~~TRINITY_DN11174_c0_g1_i1.p1  ORF type:complete len:1416 (+),score=263.14 TRINITY_DN11174_c0_g1_i1:217-4248(+)